MPGRPPREVTAERERQAWELRTTRGFTEQQIADHLEIHVSTVCKALQRIERRLAGEFRERAEEIKARQTTQLEHIAAEALQQWRRSCEDAEKQRTVEKGNEVTVITERKGQSGNPALLEKALQALGEIRKIWGLDAPRQVEASVSGPAGGPIPFALTSLDSLSTDELTRRLAEADALLADGALPEEP